MPPALPPNARHYDRGVGQIGGRQVSNGASSKNRYCSLGPLQCRHALLHSRSAGSGGGRSRRGVELPLYSGDTLCVQGGGIWGLPSHMGGSRQRERNNGGAVHPNNSLMQVLPPCRRFFGWRAHFSPPPHLLASITNFSLLNPTLDLSFTGRGSRPVYHTRGRLMHPPVGVLTPPY